jgi:F0F1-type ATP synthase beta subunit
MPTKRNIKKRLTRKLKTLNRKMKRKLTSKKNRKKRISFKKMSKKRLAKTVKKARKKILKQLKKIKLVMKGGESGPELIQTENQTPDSMEATAGSMIVAGDANQLDVLTPSIKEGMLGMFGGAKLPKSIKNKRKTTMKHLKKLKKRK